VPISTESSFSFNLINTSIRQSHVLSVSVYSGVAFQPAHCVLSLKNLTAARLSLSILRETLVDEASEVV
jgi:hypothetical protein